MPRPIVGAPLAQARRLRPLAACLLAVLSFLALPSCGCSTCGDPPPVVSGAPLAQAPHFLLEDVNDTSASHATQISPRAYLGGISAWYFGHAT